MKSVGIDLHKQSISICVVNQERGVLERKRLFCNEPERIAQYFTELGEFQAVIEATASYEWLWALLEPLASRIVLAHPGKLRIIAESTRKSDKLDAEVLATFLALDMIPQAYHPLGSPLRCLDPRSRGFIIHDSPGAAFCAMPFEVMRLREVEPMEKEVKPSWVF